MFDVKRFEWDDSYTPTIIRANSIKNFVSIQYQSSIRWIEPVICFILYNFYLFFNCVPRSSHLIAKIYLRLSIDRKISTFTLTETEKDFYN